MANEKKQAIIYGLVNDVLVELMAKTNIENVVYSVGEDGTEVYLSTKLAEIIADINTKASTEAMNAAISAAIDGLIDGAPGTYDTLKEISDYIASHEDVVTALNEAIGNKADKTAVTELSNALDALTTTVNGKADKATTLAGYGITDAYTKTETDTKIADAVKNATGGESAASVKAALEAYQTENDAAVEALEEKAHEHSNKTVLDGITAAKVGAWDAAEQNAKDYADGLAGNYDSKGSAAQALTDAKAYADGLAGNYDTKGAAAAAETAAKEYADGLNTAMGTRVGAVEGDVETLIGDDANKSARAIAAEETAKIVAGADTAYDTLKEIADWISTHGSDAATMQSNILALQNQLSGIAAGTGTVKKYVDDAIAALNVGQYALAADLTALAARVADLEADTHTHSNKALLDTYTQTEANLADAVAKKHEHSNKAELDKIATGDKSKWDAAAEKAHEHANKSVLDGITAAQVSEWDSKGTVYVQASQPANLAAGDLWIKIQ